MNNFFNYNNFFFDFDGTICNSSDGIITSLSKSINLVTGSNPEINSDIIGPPLKEMISGILPYVKNDNLESILNEFRKDYDLNGFKISELYPHFMNILARLKSEKKKIFIVTNKPSYVTNKILILHEIDKYFFECVSVDKTNILKKSKSTIINRIIAGQNLNISESIFIGDTMDDLNAAKKSGLDYLNYNNGYGKIEKECFSIDCYSQLL